METRKWSPLVKRGSRAAARVVARSSASAAVVGAVARGGVAALSSTAALRRGREALDDAVAGQHAAVDGEVLAHHEGAHGGVLLGEYVRFVRQVGLVFAAVDKNVAGKAVGIAVAFVGRVHPSTATAETYESEEPLVSFRGIWNWYKWFELKLYNDTFPCVKATMYQ